MFRRPWTALLASLLFLATACGTTGGDLEADGTATTTTEEPSGDETSTTETPTTDDESDDEGDGEGDGEGSNPEFCAAAAELSALFDDLAEQDYQGFVDAIEQGEDEYDTILATIPDDLKDEAEIVVELVKAMAAEMDRVKDDPDAAEKVAAKVEELRTDEAEAADEALTAYEEATCPGA